jgi:hypothetical protein
METQTRMEFLLPTQQPPRLPEKPRNSSGITALTSMMIAGKEESSLPQVVTPEYVPHGIRYLENGKQELSLTITSEVITMTSGDSPTRPEKKVALAPRTGM